MLGGGGGMFEDREMEREIGSLITGWEDGSLLK